jgi:hypothetical protein
MADDWMFHDSPRSTHCRDEGWVCEEHPALAWPHYDCAGPGIPCSHCNTGSPPRYPLGFVSFVTRPVSDSARMAGMSTDRALLHNSPKPPSRQPKRGEVLFDFVRPSDRAPMSCELRFHGQTYGWEAQFFERGELLFALGAFVTHQGAIQWAEDERQRLEQRT